METRKGENRLGRKLVLRKETLRQLTDAEMEKVVGGQGAYAPHTARFTNCQLCGITDNTCFGTCTC